MSKNKFRNSSEGTPRAASPAHAGRFPRVRWIALVAAAALVFFGVAMIRAGQQRISVERIWELGGYVARASDNPTRLYRTPAWYEAIFGEELMNPVLSVRLAETDTTDDDLLLVSRLKQIEFLDLADTRVGDKGLAHLSRLVHLKDLALTGMAISDAGLRSLDSCVELRALSLEETNLTDEGLLGLTTLPELEWLNLSGTRITGAGLRQLARCSQLRTLVVDGCLVSREDIAELAGALPQLQVYESEHRRPLFWPTSPTR